LRERTSDDNYHAASDHRDYKIIAAAAAGGDRLPGQQRRVRGLGRVTGVWMAFRSLRILIDES
jgi:hypothetical protein